MITDFLIQLGIAFLNILAQPFLLLPNVALPANLTNIVNTISTAFSTLNPLFPLDALLIIIGVLVIIESAILVYKFAYWVIKKIPTIS